jgi:YhcH/YjgK/YiaL family protein
MIYDVLSNWKRYFSGGLWEKAFLFLETLDEKAEEGEHAIDGVRCFARVMSYETKRMDAADVVVESHRRYADIQMSLSGAEAIDWFARQSSKRTGVEYSPARDVEFYENPGESVLRIHNFPGTFCVLFPEDVHRPQMAVHQVPSLVKKVVVKVELQNERCKHPS